ncbi:hypothetical protein PENSTE_c027G08721 [Penicillium steckii]|uniref:Uncharacterized protein n=1 Tax=Penicillium steckii TaxID=303698 RepID=A0A1V6SNP2_9EURO|nr:hypothetical protein PENSTE_c027G08721 [Penicillium steckii]
MANAFQEFRNAPSSSYPSAVDQPVLNEDQGSPVRDGREPDSGNVELLETEDLEALSGATTRPARSCSDAVLLEGDSLAFTLIVIASATFDTSPIAEIA